MALQSLMYVSCSTIEPTEAEAAVGQIVASAMARNADLGVTGALLFTGTHFAQVLEGSVPSLDQIMAAVARDPRHRDLLVVACDMIPERRFKDWSMAYFGPSLFVSQHITRLLNAPSPADRRRGVHRLSELMSEFSSGPRPVR